MTVPKFENFKDIEVKSFWDRTWGWAEILEEEKQKPNPDPKWIAIYEREIEECIGGDTPYPEWVNYLPREVLIHYYHVKLGEGYYSAYIDIDYRAEGDDEIDYDFWAEYFKSTFKKNIWEVTDEEFENLDLKDLEDEITNKYYEKARDTVSDEDIWDAWKDDYDSHD